MQVKMNKPVENQIYIKSLLRDEVVDLVKRLNEPEYRANQILEWLYSKRCSSWMDMTNLPLQLREELSKNYQLSLPELVKVQTASDSTRKFLWKLRDGSFIESVLIPANPALYGEPSDRLTLCISTQVGCAYKCRFCASGLLGFKRNLEVDEIVDQVIAVERWGQENLLSQEQLRKKEKIISNLVFMGMGEPLANYDNLLRAIKILNADWGCNIGARKITISTCGLVPQIRRLAAERMQLRLSVSLHGATNDVRNRIMPINKKYPLEELIEACRFYNQNKNGMITFEYILIEGVNDSDEQAEKLASLIKPLRAKVNIIPYNRVEGLSFNPPPEDIQIKFLKTLKRRRIVATLRKEKGGDIDAACGQLRLKTELSLNSP
jgi:23S rRNA (adenine2503-C2)-methyltransferase